MRDDHSSVAVSAEIFCWVETQAGHIAERTCPAPFVESTDSLGIVFDEWQVARFGERQNRVHVGGEAVKMNCDNGARSRRYAALEFGGIDVVGFRANICEDRPCSQCADCAASCDKRESWQKHFVARLH